MKVTVCIGSSCHLKGSKQVVEQLKHLLRENDLNNAVELSGIFCMGNCRQGVCVAVEDEIYSVTPETTEDFFKKEIISKV